MNGPTADFVNDPADDRGVALAKGGDTPTEGEQLALAAMAVDLADPASRARVRGTVDRFGEGGSSATRSRMLSKRLRVLALADTSNSKAAADLQRLASTIRQLDPSRRSGGRRGVLRRLFSPTRKKLDKLNATRKDIEVLLTALSGSAEALRQSEVALDGFEADIREEHALITKDIELADDYEAALVSALQKTKSGATDQSAVRFVENEVLFPLEQHRQLLRSLLAVNQQAAASLSILRETNLSLIQNIRLVTLATRHSLDTSALLRRMQEARNAEGDDEEGHMPGMEAFEDSLDELSRALDEHDAWRAKSLSKRDGALQALDDLGQRAFEEEV